MAIFGRLGFGLDILRQRYQLPQNRIQYGKTDIGQHLTFFVQMVLQPRFSKIVVTLDIMSQLLFYSAARRRFFLLGGSSALSTTRRQ